jgi:hypothetical protein
MLGGVEKTRTRGSARPQTDGGRPRAAARGLVWGVAGFVLGAAFWVILGALSVTGGALPQLSPLWDQQGEAGSGCTSLALDRSKGHTTAEPCRRSAQPLREAVAASTVDLVRP